MIITTASAFEPKFDAPEDGTKEATFLDNFDEHFDGVLFLATTVAYHKFMQRMLSHCGYDFKADQQWNTKDSYVSYERYDNMFADNHLNISSSTTGALIKKTGEGIIRFSLTGKRFMDDTLSQSYSLVSPIEFNGNHFRYSTFGLSRVYLQQYLKETGNNPIILKCNWQEILAELPPEIVADLEETVELKSFSKFINSYLGNIIIEPSMSLPKDKSVDDYSDDSELFEALADSTFNVSVELNIPRGVVRYVTQSEEQTQQALTLSSYGQNLMFGIYDSDFTSYKAIQPLDSVISQTKDIIKSVKLTNEDDMCMMYDGQLRWVPTIDTLDIWEDFNNKSVEEVKGIIQFNATNEVRNQVFFTDWGLGKLTYQNLEGRTNMMDILGAKPATVSHYKKLLDDRDQTVTLLNRLITNTYNVLKRKGVIKSFEDLIETEDLHMLFLDITPTHWEEIKQGKKPQDIVSVINHFLLDKLKHPTDFIVGAIGLAEARSRTYRNAPEHKDLYENSELFQFVDTANMWSLEKLLDFSIYQPVVRMLKMLKPSDYMDYMEQIGVVSATEQLPIHSAVLKFSRSIEIRNADQKAREGLGVDNAPEDYTPQAVHNIREGVSFLPHQVKVDYRLSKEPSNGVLSVEPGGGKTILAITDALRHQAQGRRVLVVCPNYLMRNYIEDSSYVTGGKMNVVCIDTGVYNSYGEERLKSLIEDAPANTLFVVGLNVFSQGKNIKYNYNGTTITINQIVEFLRSFTWDVVIIDESHTLANSNSNRSMSMVRFLSGIPLRRELTGTFINNNCMDAFGQTKYLDPGIFGSSDSFIEKYAAVMKGDKVISWRKGAERDIATTLATNVDFVNITRKEWAALLPERRDHFHIVKLSEAQQKVYKAILTAILDEIRKDPEMMRLIEEAENEDDSSTSALEAKLRQYLARIERFLASCDLDELGKTLLSGEDLISPKSAKINEILEEHMSQKGRGKVLIFTSYKNSAKSIYEHLDPKFKKMALHYEAERKDELIPIMKKNDKIRIVIGVEQSLNTGHNFQQFDRLIRAESIWNPGTLNQAESRINRPDPKNKGEARSHIDMDWVLCDDTIDITKTSRLVSKILSAARFNNIDPRYDKLPDLPIISMNLESIEHNNSYFGSLDHYAEGYSQYLEIQRQEYQEFRETTSHKVPLPIPSAGVMKGSAFLDVPFIPGMVVPFQEELGLQSIEDFALEQGLSVSAIDPNDLKNRRVYTEHGEGVITGVYSGSIKVKLDTGNTTSVNKLCAFLIPEGQSNIREQIKMRVGLQENVKVSVKTKEKTIKEVQVLNETKTRNRKVIEPQNSLLHDQEVEVYLGSMNNALAVWLNPLDEDLSDKVLSKLDINHSGSYWYCHCRRYTHLEDMLNLLQEKFDVPQSQIDRLEEWLEVFESGRSKLFNLEKATRMEIRNWYLRKRKKVPVGELHVFPLIEDGQFFLIAFGDNQSSDTKLSRIKVRGAHWEYDEDGFYFKLFNRKPEIKEFITKDLKDAGISVSNLDEVKEDYKQLKVRK